MRALGGIPPVDKKFAQFLLNDRKVLRFKARPLKAPFEVLAEGYWDDHTPYGTSHLAREPSARRLRILFHPALLPRGQHL